MRIPRDERLVSDPDFLRALDLRRRGMAPLRGCLRIGDIEGAKAAVVEYFRTRKRPRWFFDLRDGRRGSLVSPWGDQVLNLQRADALLANRFFLLEGFERDFGPELKWRTEETRRLFVPSNGFKRGKFFFDLAAAYAKTGRPEYAAKFAELMDRWVQDWPLVVDEVKSIHLGILNRSDGHKGMPTGFRLLQWLHSIYSGIVFAPQVPVETAFRLFKSLWFTALQYRRFDSLGYRSANHHIWDRGTLPFVLGTMFPEIPSLAALARYGRRALVAHADRSFLADGGYEERSSGYMVVALRMFLLSLQLAALNRVSLLDRRRKARLRRAVELCASLVLPNGSGPDVGDGAVDPEKVIAFLGSAGKYFGSRRATQVIRSLGVSKYVRPVDRPFVRAARPIAMPMTVHYPTTGFFVARDAWSSRASAMVLSTPGGGLPNHGHDDALSLQLVVRGVPIVGTPVSELKGVLQQDQLRGSVAQRHFMAMTSHNVVMVGERAADPAESLSLHGRESTPVTTEWRSTEKGICVQAAHKGVPGVMVSRKVSFRYRRSWSVIDRVTGAGSRRCVLRWHFEYGARVTRRSDHFLAVCRNVRLAIGLHGEPIKAERLYRDTRWLGSNPLRPGVPAPWVWDVTFGGTGDDRIETRFEIL